MNEPCVKVRGDEIVVTVPNTDFAAIYYKLRPISLSSS
jgi:hypothetical protein